jgi:uncharacterized protein YgiM (DUF1202 family)
LEAPLIRTILPLVLGLVGALAAAPALAQVGPGYVPADHDTYLVVCTNRAGSNVNVRAAPSTQASIVGQVKPGMQIAVVGRTYGSDGMYWARVRYGRGTYFIREDYLCPISEGCRVDPAPHSTKGPTRPWPA